jgi:PKD repeat protein
LTGPTGSPDRGYYARFATAIALGLLLVVGWAGPPGTAGAHAPSVRPGSFSLSLSASPVSGPAPLLVQFQAAVAPSTTSATFNWSFGDGTGLNVTAVGSSSPSHLYRDPGLFTASVAAYSSGGSTNASVHLRVDPGNLSVGIAADPPGGPAPLTVHFTVVISGGSGTYKSILWSFGDGDNGSGADILYTYAHAGSFPVSVNVTDELGHSAVATTSVVVDAGSAVSGGGDGGPALSTPLLLTLVALVGLLVLGLVVYGLYSIRPYRRLRSGSSPAVPDGTPEGEIGGGAASTSPELVSPVVFGVSASPPDATTTVAGPNRSDASSDPRLSERILAHLYWRGRTDSHGVPRFEATQNGIAEALGLRQSVVSKVVSRLVAAGVLRTELLHVTGARRRVKVYTLTARGEAFARSLRPPGDRSPPR